MSDEQQMLIESTEQAKSIWPGLMFFIAVLLSLGFGAYKTQQWLQDEQRLPVQKVVFSGQRQVLQDEVLESLIRTQQTGSFFALDVNEVHALLENLPWVYRASVRKRWPNSLHVYLVEQTAVAVWNDDLLLNQYGDVFDGGNYSKPLPLLFGPGGSEKTTLSGLKAMQSLLGNTDVNVKQLFLSERFAWRVELNNEIQLNLGRKEFIARLQRFVDVYPLLLEQNRAINYIDLRYDTGLAVGWNENPDDER